MTSHQPPHTSHLTSHSSLSGVHLVVLPLSFQIRHKCLLPNWFVSLSVKVRGYCSPHLPLPEKAEAGFIHRHNPFNLNFYSSVGKKKSYLIRIADAFVLQPWYPVLFRTFWREILRNEFQLMNLNEAQCTLLYSMNSQLAQPEVIQSSQPTCSQWYLAHLS